MPLCKNSTATVALACSTRGAEQMPANLNATYKQQHSGEHSCRASGSPSGRARSVQGLRLFLRTVSGKPFINQASWTVSSEGCQPRPPHKPFSSGCRSQMTAPEKSIIIFPQARGRCWKCPPSTQNHRGQRGLPRMQSWPTMFLVTWLYLLPFVLQFKNISEVSVCLIDRYR